MHLCSLYLALSVSVKLINVHLSFQIMTSVRAKAMNATGCNLLASTVPPTKPFITHEEFVMNGLRPGKKRKTQFGWEKLFNEPKWKFLNTAQEKDNKAIPTKVFIQRTDETLFPCTPCTQYAFYPSIELSSEKKTEEEAHIDFNPLYAEYILQKQDGIIKHAKDEDIYLDYRFY